MHLRHVQALMLLLILDIDLCRLKIFLPIMCLAFAILVPVNYTNNFLEGNKDATYSSIDKLSVSNIPSESLRLVIFFCATSLIIFIYVLDNM